MTEVLDYDELVRWVPLVVDTRNATTGIEAEEGRIWKA